MCHHDSYIDWWCLSSSGGSGNAGADSAGASLDLDGGDETTVANDTGLGGGGNGSRVAAAAAVVGGGSAAGDRGSRLNAGNTAGGHSRGGSVTGCLGRDRGDAESGDDGEDGGELHGGLDSGVLKKVFVLFVL